MKIHTASQAVSFAAELEEASGEFYRQLIKKFPETKDTIQSFIKENEKHVKNIQRAYYSVITDAIEGSYAFDLAPDSYKFEDSFEGDITKEEALKKALDMEKKIIKFYNDAVEQSESLMADVPKAFKLVVKKKNNRLVVLHEL